MKCEPVQKLVPLYVEGDLPERQAENVRRHLDGCAACRESAEQLRLSQRWLRKSLRAPEVSGAALDDMRRAVWRRIHQEPPRAALWVELERAWASLRHFGAQPAVAVAAVFVVVLGSVSLSRLGGYGGRAVLQETSVTAPAIDDRPMAERVHGTERLLAQARAVEMGKPLEVAAAEEALPVAAEDRLRIEIKTRDPNVRIIWFGSKDKAN